MSAIMCGNCDQMESYDLHQSLSSCPTGDALGYAKDQGDACLEKEGYNVLYPAYGTYVGGTFSRFLEYPVSLIITVGAVIPGHIIGRIRSSRVKDCEEQ